MSALDSLWETDRKSVFSEAYLFQILPTFEGKVTSTALCEVYPLIATTFDTGKVAIFNWVPNTLLCDSSFSSPATSVSWLNLKLDGKAASLIVGFGDGVLGWLSIVRTAKSGNKGKTDHKQNNKSDEPRQTDIKDDGKDDEERLNYGEEAEQHKDENNEEGNEQHKDKNKAETDQQHNDIEVVSESLGLENEGHEESFNYDEEKEQRENQNELKVDQGENQNGETIEVQNDENKDEMFQHGNETKGNTKQNGKNEDKMFKEKNETKGKTEKQNEESEAKMFPQEDENKAGISHKDENDVEMFLPKNETENHENKDEEKTGKEGNKIESEFKFILILQATIKPHTERISSLSFNKNTGKLVSQGMDSKMFFFRLENFSFIPLGFYINYHQVDKFGWFNYSNLEEDNESVERLLIFCKHSYILEVDVPESSFNDDKTVFPETYNIRQNQCQVYKINGMLNYHKLGDQVLENDLQLSSDMPQAAREKLWKLKLDEKREIRESREKAKGLTESIKPPNVLCVLSSTFPDRMWLSLGGNDSGYLFEFELQKNFQSQPINFVPSRAVEILTAENRAIISMSYSDCGRYIFMGIEDGSLHIGCMDEIFDPTTATAFRVFPPSDKSHQPIAGWIISSNGSMIRRTGDEGNIVESQFNLFAQQEVNNQDVPALSEESVKECEGVIGSEKPCLEDILQQELADKHIQTKEDILGGLEELKENYNLVKSVYNNYLEKCKSILKEMYDLTEDFKLDLEVISCNPRALVKFNEKTSSLIKLVDIAHERDVVRVSLLKKKYLDCFKGRIQCEKQFMEEGNLQIESFRGCSLSSEIVKTTPKSHSVVYKGKVKVRTDYPGNEIESVKKGEEQCLLEDKLAETEKDIVDYDGDSEIADSVVRFNKRKQELIKYLKEIIAATEALDSIRLDKSKYNNALMEIEKLYFKFKDVTGLENVFPDIISTFTEKKENTILFVKKIHNFWTMYNSYFADALKMKEEKMNLNCPNHSLSKNKSEPKQTRMFADRRKKHIYFKENNGRRNKEKQIPTKIDWNSFNVEKVDFAQLKIDRGNTELYFANQEKEWYQRRYDCLLSLLMAAKPKINCEKKFYEIRLIMKCIELNSMKDSASEEKQCIRIIEEIENMKEKESKELSTIEKELASLRNLRQEEKEKWMNLYHELIKVIGKNHKHKSYFKQVFKKKIVPKGEKPSQRRHTSSESSESEQNIHSADDDSQTVVVTEIDKDLLGDVMQLRIKRQDVENTMKELKRKIRADTVKSKTANRKILRLNDAMEETNDRIEAILNSRKQKWESFIWPLVLYPKNVHSEYIIYNTDHHLSEQKETMEEGMLKIYNHIEEQLFSINSIVDQSVDLLASYLVRLEIDDMIDVVIKFSCIVVAVSNVTDKYFQSVYHLESSESLISETTDLSEQDPQHEESFNFIEDILATQGVLFSQSENSTTESESESSSNRDSVHTVKSNASKKEKQEDFDLNELKKEDNLLEKGTTRKEKKESIQKAENSQEKEAIQNEDLQEKEAIQNKGNEQNNQEIQSRKVSNENNLTEFHFNEVSKSSVQTSDLSESEIISSAITTLDYSKLLQRDDDYYVPDYYMLPFTYSATEVRIKDCQSADYNKPNRTQEGNTADLKRPTSVALRNLDATRKQILNSGLTDSSVNKKRKASNELLKISNQNLTRTSEKVVNQFSSIPMNETTTFASNERYPTHPGGGLVLSFSILKDMERKDPDNYPYTNFYQKAEVQTEEKADPITEHIQLDTPLELNTMFHFSAASVSEFVLVDKAKVFKILEACKKSETSSRELGRDLRLLQNKAISAKHALTLKQQELVKEKNDLGITMKSKFNCEVDLDYLQDAIDNPRLLIRKKELQMELKPLKKELKKVKESESLALKSLNQLRFEDTRICYRLLELKKEFKRLDKTYSSNRKDLPKTGVNWSREEDED